jgi:hypothetical protein
VLSELLALFLRQTLDVLNGCSGYSSCMGDAWLPPS